MKRVFAPLLLTLLCGLSASTLARAPGAERMTMGRSAVPASPFRLTVSQLSWITIAVCVFWVAVLGQLGREYRSVVPVAVPA